MFLEILLFLVLIISVFHYYTRCGKNGSLMNNIPGPPPWPLVGNFPSFLAPQEEIWTIFRKMSNDYYPTYKLWFAHEIILTIQHPDDIKILLSSTDNIDKSFVYEFVQPWLKTGLLNSTGKKWHTRRRILTSAFHFTVLKKYMDIIAEHSKKVIESLKGKDKVETIQDLLSFASDYALDVICETAMGVQLQEMKEVRKEYKSAVHKMGDILYYRFARPWFYNHSIFQLAPKYREQTGILKVLHGFSKKIIDERKSYHDITKGRYLNQITRNETNDNQEDEALRTREKRLAMLDLLISTSRNESLIDDNGIQEEVDTFIFEGFDTVSTSLCFSLLLLAEHKDIQKRIREEINDVFKKSNGTLGYSEIQELQYLEMCIKESLRLYPSVPLVARRLNQDLQLRNYHIPKGTNVIVAIFDVHRDANFWSEPNKFDPDRFLPDKIRDRNPYCYIPFSAGPRNCIGQKFAMMELKAVIANILKHFELEAIDLAHEIPILADMVIRPARPIRMKLIPIE